MILADKIIEERKKNGWTQEDLAQKLGVSRQSVSKWESAGAIPDLKKIIQLADLFGVSTDYLLKDEVEKENTETICDTDCELHRVTMEEANAYMDEKKKAAPMLANATTLCILSPISLFLVSTFNDSLAISIACAILLGMVALAVFIFIKTGIKLSSLQYLEQEPFETEYGVTGLVKEKNQNYQEHYSFCLACGVVLCILSVIPLIIAGCMESMINAPYLMDKARAGFRMGHGKELTIYFKKAYKMLKQANQWACLHRPWKIRKITLMNNGMNSLFAH